MKYTITELEKTFGKHHDEYEEQKKMQEKQWKEQHPDATEPFHPDAFSLDKALQTMCREINKLRKPSK